MIINKQINSNIELKISDWELDFYSRPIIEENGKKRWELIISSTKNFKSKDIFLWNKICPANEVNSIWLTKALNEAVKEAKKKRLGQTFQNTLLEVINEILDKKIS